MDQTEKLIGAGKTIKVRGEDLVVKPLSVKMLFKVQKELATGFHDLISAVKDKKIDVKGETTEVVTPEFVMSIIGFAPKLINIFDVAVSQEPGYCEELSLDDFSEVLLAVLEVNDIAKIVKNFKAVGKLMPIGTLSDKQ